MNDTTTSMTVAEAAAALGVSERTVWRYLRSGRLAGETIGPAGSQRTLVDRAAIQAIIAGRGGGDEIAALKADVARLADENAALRAERDQLRRALAAARTAMQSRARPASGRAASWMLAGLSKFSG